MPISNTAPTGALGARLNGRTLRELSDNELMSLASDPGISEREHEALLSILGSRAIERAAAQPPRRVSLVAIEIPFWDRVADLVKWALAAIPATIILAVVGFGTMAILSGVVAGLRQ